MDACAYRGVHREHLEVEQIFVGSNLYLLQLVSVISLLSSDTPNCDSPANVDAAKEVRTDPAGKLTFDLQISPDWFRAGYRKKVRRLVRKSAEEAYE